MANHILFFICFVAQQLLTYTVAEFRIETGLNCDETTRNNCSLQIGIFKIRKNNDQSHPTLPNGCSEEEQNTGPTMDIDNSKLGKAHPRFWIQHVSWNKDINNKFKNKDLSTAADEFLKEIVRFKFTTGNGETHRICLGRRGNINIDGLTTTYKQFLLNSCVHEGHILPKTVSQSEIKEFEKNFNKQHANEGKNEDSFLDTKKDNTVILTEEEDAVNQLFQVKNIPFTTHLEDKAKDNDRLKFKQLFQSNFQAVLTRKVEIVEFNSKQYEFKEARVSYGNTRDETNTFDDAIYHVSGTVEHAFGVLFRANQGESLKGIQSCKKHFESNFLKAQEQDKIKSGQENLNSGGKNSKKMPKREKQQQNLKNSQQARKIPNAGKIENKLCV